MTDSDTKQRESGSTEATARLEYEAPSLTVIGPLDRITLGSGGSKGDAAGLPNIRK